MTEITKNILENIYKKRPRDVKKYDYGLLLVIGGSEFYSGSPALSSLAAFRAGVDMVRIVAPKRAADIIASFTPDLAAYPLQGDWLTKEHLPTLISMTESVKAVSRGKMAVVIGGGAGRTEETQEAILEYLSQVSAPVVIDADAIHAVGKNPEVVSGKPFLITPHTYEFFVLTGKEIYQLPERQRRVEMNEVHRLPERQRRVEMNEVHRLPDEEKIKMVQEEAKRLKTTILLKGAIDIISSGDEVVINKTGSGQMTVGGMGDTLAGIAGALMARGISPIIAGQAAAYINGLAGELAGKKFGESVMATDLINEISNVLPKP